METQLAQAVDAKGEPGPGMDKDIQHPLTLFMPVDLDRLDKLKATLEKLKEPDNAQALNKALDRVGTVHATRFVLLEDEQGQWAKIGVIAIFDGSMKAYIEAYAREIGHVFDALLACVTDSPDKPSLPVRNDVDTLVRYVENHDVKPATGHTYSAYPDHTALDICEAIRPRQDTAFSVRP
jgi:hypothetical protein